jgi:DNA-nicking Smr family endonuclease
VLDIITGRGKHSRGGKAILFPKIKAYLISLGYKVRPSADQGRISVTLRA